jgi:hypothetical protein
MKLDHNRDKLSGVKPSVRLVQLMHPLQGRRVARVEENTLVLLDADSVYDLAARPRDLRAAGEQIEYEPVYEGTSEWRILPPIDHPEPARCLVSGTGLTHRKSAQSRDSMHTSQTPVPLTDSMKIYEWGVEGGKPAPGAIGVQPEWFYKGCGTALRAHNEPLEIPVFALDGGDEAEIAGIYFIDEYGAPVRLGFAAGNEFSDHKMERMNYLYLAPSKLRHCGLGPELVVTEDFASIAGEASVTRGGAVIWSKPLHTGEAAMCHSLENLEHHHFKYSQHRRPGDIHVHFFGAGAFSFSDGIALKDGDIMTVGFDGFGKPLRNPVRVSPRGEQLQQTRAWHPL